MTYQVKCDRCGEVADIAGEPVFAHGTVLPNDWHRLFMGRERHAEAETTAQLCPGCAALVRNFVHSAARCCKRCQ